MTWEGGGLGLFMYLLIMEEGRSGYPGSLALGNLKSPGYLRFLPTGGQVLRQSFYETQLNLEIFIVTTAMIQPAGRKMIHASFANFRTYEELGLIGSDSNIHQSSLTIVLTHYTPHGNDEKYLVHPFEYRDHAYQQSLGMSDLKGGAVSIKSWTLTNVMRCLAKCPEVRLQREWYSV